MVKGDVPAEDFAKLVSCLESITDVLIAQNESRPCLALDRLRDVKNALRPLSLWYCDPEGV